MKSIISIKNLSFFCNNKDLFNNFNLEIMEKDWLTIVGNNGSGKSSLIKFILGVEQFDGTIIVDSINNKENIKEVRKKIGAVFSDPNVSFILDSVDSELEFSLKNLNMSEQEIIERKKAIINDFHLKKLLALNPHDLSGGEKQMVAIATSLISNPKILILDESLDMLDFYQKQMVLKIIKKYHKRGMTVINIIQNIEDALLGDKILIIDNGNIVSYGKKEEVFEREDVFKKLNLELPFVIDLSIKLRYYKMVDKLYFNMEELVDDIWK